MLRSASAWLHGEHAAFLQHDCSVALECGPSIVRCISLLIIAVDVVVVCQGATASHKSSDSVVSSCFKVATNYNGNDISQAPAATVQECQSQCLATSACKFFTFKDAEDPKICMLKTTVRKEK